MPRTYPGRCRRLESTRGRPGAAGTKARKLHGTRLASDQSWGSSFLFSLSSLRAASAEERRSFSATRRWSEQYRAPASPSESSNGWDLVFWGFHPRGRSHQAILCPPLTPSQAPSGFPSPPHLGPSLADCGPALLDLPPGAGGWGCVGASPVRGASRPPPRPLTDAPQFSAQPFSFE